MVAVVVAVVAALAPVLAPVVAPGAGTAQAAVSGGAFRAGDIVSDAVFFDASTMDERQVQAFLDARGSACRAGEMPCLKDYREDTPSRAADANCAGYTGAAQQSAAQVVVAVARSCGVNPRALLVLLQKESGLVSKTAPSAISYRSATGYGCPDGKPCNAEYYGFSNQVYRAAWAFKNYAAHAATSPYRPGRSNEILFHPDRACGSAPVHIENQATAGLYRYTPYQPNAAALANVYGTGDACSAYGNRNFWRIMTDWFGSTQHSVLGEMFAAWMADGGPDGFVGAPTAAEECTAAGCSQRFARGSTAWSPATGAHLVKGDIEAAWRARGGATGALGVPTGPEQCGPAGGGCRQDFAAGAVLWSPAAGARVVEGAVHAAWRAAGGATGDLGEPLADQRCTSAQRCVQEFTGGTVAWLAGADARVVTGQVRAAWTADGGAGGFLGLPTGAERCGLAGGGCSQAFERGTVVSSPATGTRVVKGEIDAAWRADGAQDGFLGHPVANERCGLAAGGCTQRFTRGTIAWSPATGARPVKGDIAATWTGDGAETGFLGYPTANERCGLAGGGCTQRFTRGTIAWTPGTGARAVKGEIDASWTADGAETGYLGHPTANERCGAAGSGCTQAFSRGTIAWSPTTGVSRVKGEISASWTGDGAQAGYLGHPTANERCGLAGGGCTQAFSRGTIAWSPATGASRVKGEINASWTADGAQAGYLGHPTANERCGLAGGGCTQAFSRGTIAWSPATGAARVKGQIDAAWRGAGAQGGTLGYPTANEALTAVGWTQAFQRGRITVTRDGRTTLP
ncbi:LGFP repeat-containing protein [Quadrisphaera sp. DSM 44207]|uniref:LGFP repeat-containing protein n=1 Tax=Quadrisphaera sp. DSM 44207 TaxID=1881057 RepID=UPI0015A4225A|nr:hypothetical protein [Quadrisphaera sp. DSM 44207]